MNNKLDSTDISILTALQHNSRISNAELSAKVNLSQTPCLRRLRRLEKSGLIERYSVQLNHQLIGASVSAFVFVKVNKNTSENASDFESAVADLPEVTECCVLAGAHDYMLRVSTATLQSFELFLKEKLANVPMAEGIESTIILNQLIKRDAPLPTPQIRGGQ
ncbi:MAG: Lrp/AsnC family transcriptional regulator [Porticoccaceae bacterium]|nr:Lrp/AsnC family transcriptional regulator [Porticoccaceae bacterium]|tara:strand:- start:235 stop:723 length:489 start_codon:yes stop_codon:yes gene_type:complete